MGFTKYFRFATRSIVDFYQWNIFIDEDDMTLTMAGAVSILHDMTNKVINKVSLSVFQPIILTKHLCRGMARMQ